MSDVDAASTTICTKKMSDVDAVNTMNDTTICTKKMSDVDAANTMDDKIEAHLLKVTERKEKLLAMQHEMKLSHLFVTQQNIIYEKIVSKNIITQGFQASHSARNKINELHTSTTSSGASNANTRNNSLQYGEIHFDTIAVALLKLKNMYGGWKGQGIFYDLGSGVGNVVIAAALVHRWQAVIGIEILEPLYEISGGLIEKYHLEQQLSDSLMTTNVTTMQGDLLTLHKWWLDADVVFCNTLAFDDALLDALVILLQKLKTNTFILTTGRLNDKERLADTKFECLEFSIGSFSWGDSTMWIYKKK